MNNGVLMLAGGHPNYGKMAFNLAMSIKDADPSIPIALVHNGESISKLFGNMLSAFDFLIHAPESSYRIDGRDDWFFCKTHMYDLSPFSSTIFLDADTLWLPNRRISDLFVELADVPYTMANRDFLTMAKAPFNEKYSMWCNVHEVKLAFNLSDDDRYYSIHSEFVKFDRNEANRTFFDTAKEIYRDPRITPTSFAGGIPDEYAFAVAQMLCNHYPHATPFLPGYWGKAEQHNKLSDSDLYSRYHYISLGGSAVPSSCIQRYNRLSMLYAQRYGATDWYQHKDKRQWLTSRTLI